MLMKLSGLEKYLQKQSLKKTLVIAVAHDWKILKVAEAVIDKKIANVLLVGDEKKIRAISADHKIDLSSMKIINESKADKGCVIAIKLITAGKADILMKGHLGTGNFLKYLSSSKYGMKKDRIFSHLLIVEIPGRNKLVGITDIAINITPDLKTKRYIIENSVTFARKLGIETPKVAVLSAVELINTAIQSTVDAGLLTRMAQLGQIRHCLIEGPLDYLKAIDSKYIVDEKSNAEIKGDADILLVPDMESGNILNRSMLYFSKTVRASFLLGTSAPVILCSEVDTVETYLNSISLAAVIKY